MQTHGLHDEGGTPVPLPTFHGDLFSDEVLTDYRSSMKAIRELGGIVWLSKLNMYGAGRFTDVVAALRAPDILISSRGTSANALLNSGDTPAPITTISTYGVLHRDLKRMLMKPLMPAALKDIAAPIEDAADSLVATLADGAEIEAMEQLASRLPLSIVAPLAGLKTVSAQQLLAWSSAIFNAFGPLDGERAAATFPAIQAFTAYGMTLTRSDVVPGSWTDHILEIAERGDLDLGIARNLIFDYLLPSLDTTILATGELLYQLATTPGAFETIRQRPELIPGAVNEAVRLATPVRGFTRYVSDDFTLAGTTLPAGSRIFLLYAAGNRDPRQFSEPDRFDPERNPREQLGLGHCVHLCGGIHLARLEMEAVLCALVRNARTIELSGTLTRVINNSAQGYATLPLRIAA